jgi:origin recognition complex subunit 3
VDEPDQISQSRAQSYHRCRAFFEREIKDIVDTSHKQVFLDLTKFVQAKFKAKADEFTANEAKTTPSYTSYARQIPTGLVLAGGVNSADHAETFHQLARALRQSGAPVALVRSQDLLQGGQQGLTAALKCVAHQLTGVEHYEAIDMRPLEDWCVEYSGLRVKGPKTPVNRPWTPVN